MLPGNGCFICSAEKYSTGNDECQQNDNYWNQDYFLFFVQYCHPFPFSNQILFSSVSNETDDCMLSSYAWCDQGLLIRIIGAKIYPLVPVISMIKGLNMYLECIIVYILCQGDNCKSFDPVSNASECKRIYASFSAGVLKMPWKHFFRSGRKVEIHGE